MIIKIHLATHLMLHERIRREKHMSAATRQCTTGPQVLSQSIIGVKLLATSLIHTRKGHPTLLHMLLQLRPVLVHLATVHIRTRKSSEVAGFIVLGQKGVLMERPRAVGVWAVELRTD